MTVLSLNRLAVVFLAGLVGFVGEAQAQFSGSGSGTSSSRSNSSSMFGSGTSGQNSTRQGGSGGSGGMFNSDLGQMQQDALSNANSRSSRGEGNFVGADSNDVQNITGYDQSSQGNRSGRSNASSSRSTRRNSSSLSRNGLQGGFSNNFMGGNSSRGSSRRSGRDGYGQSATQVQPTLSLGFDYAAPPARDIGASFSARVQQSTSLAPLASVRVEMQDGVATLNGAVASDHQRALAAQLVALQPGVRRVDNRLTVSPAGPSLSPPAR
jgi:hypothetical protein